ncbi:MAG: hypothetical protein ABI026_02805 [Gemmatimonadaceae bacterium]
MALPSKELSDRALDALITREKTRIVAPLTEWYSLSKSLKQEGLVRDPAGTRPLPESAYVAETRPRGNGWMKTTGRWTMRLAASVALVGAGVVAGRGMTFGNAIIDQIHMAMADSSSNNVSVRPGQDAFSSSAAARKTLLRAETDYQRAAAFLAASDSSPRTLGEPSIYQSRLAGIDEMTAASLNAIKDAPRDPLLNQYFLSAAAAREATLQQLGHSLPVGATMESF